MSGCGRERKVPTGLEQCSRSHCDGCAHCSSGVVPHGDTFANAEQASNVFGGIEGHACAVRVPSRRVQWRHFRMLSSRGLRRGSGWQRPWGRAACRQPR